MTKDEWISACLASAPPLTPEQVAILRPVFRPVLPPITADAGCDEQASPPDAQ
jgi:hypothetical protein